MVVGFFLDYATFLLSCVMKWEVLSKRTKTLWTSKTISWGLTSRFLPQERWHVELAEPVRSWPGEVMGPVMDGTVEVQEGLRPVPQKSGYNAKKGNCIGIISHVSLLAPPPFDDVCIIIPRHICACHVAIIFQSLNHKLTCFLILQEFRPLFLLLCHAQLGLSGHRILIITRCHVTSY